MYDAYPDSDREQRARHLLSGEACIWCEDAAKADTSHLCDECRKQDPEGVLGRAFPLHTVRS